MKCPHCQQTFLAPGIVASSKSKDDDWLSLDEPPGPIPKTTGGSTSDAPIKLTLEDDEDGDDEFVLQLPKSMQKRNADKIAEPPTTANPKPLSGDFLSNQDDLLNDLRGDEFDGDEFNGDEFDDFTTISESVPKINSLNHPNESKSPKSKQGKEVIASANTNKTPLAPNKTRQGVNGSAGNQTNPPPEANDVEYAKDYRVTCKVCGSYLYAKANQVGKTIKCSDCYSEMVIPPAPKLKKKATINIDQAETFQFESNPKVERRPDPFQKSANELLEDAARINEEETSEPDGYDTPQIGEWLKSVLSPFRDPTVLIHLAVLSLLAILPTIVVLKLEMAILTLGLFPGGLLFGLLSISCGMAILLAAANDEAQVSQWPTLDPSAWLGQTVLVGSAAFIAAVPCWILCTSIFGAHLLTTALTMFSIYALFPFVLLSMLDMNSIFKPFSSELSRSISKCEEAWGGFYFSSGLLFVGTFLLFAISSTSSPEGCAIISIIAAETTMFLYFGMIGRLAYAIGQVINAPPRTDTIDSTQKTDEG